MFHLDTRTSFIENLSVDNVSASSALVVDASGNLNLQGMLNVPSASAIFAKDVKVGGVLSAESVASASAGTLLIRAGKTIRKVYNAQVKTDSLIYITPVSLSSLPLYISEQVAGDHFAVQMAATQEADVRFNYWIVNQE